MENKRALIISGICFLVAILLINAYVQVKRKEMTAKFGDEVDVVVAAVNIPEYASIRPEMLKSVKVFKEFKQPRTVSAIRDVAGKSAYVPISEGEQITLTKLVYQDGRPVLDHQVAKDKRAVTLLISPHTGVGRLIRPGNLVDVVAAPSYEVRGQTLMEVKTIVQNALVLATGKRVQNEIPTRVNKQVLTYIQGQFERDRRKDFFGSGIPPNTTRPTDDYTNITIQLNTQDAEKLLFLTHSFGDRSLFLTLRNSADEEKVMLKTTLLDDVLGPESDYAKSKRRPPPLPKRKPRWYDNTGGTPRPVY